MKGNFWTLLDMSIETGMPEVPRFGIYSGCVLEQINWQMRRSGFLTPTARLVAQGETFGTTTSAGTPAALELQRFGHFNGAITRNDSALGNVVSADINYANNLDRIETIRSDGRIDGADPSIAALTGSIEVRFYQKSNTFADGVSTCDPPDAGTEHLVSIDWIPVWFRAVCCQFEF